MKPSLLLISINKTALAVNQLKVNFKEHIINLNR